MKSLADLMAEIIIAEKRREMLQDAVVIEIMQQDCRLTGPATFEDYDPCFSELCTVEKMN